MLEKRRSQRRKTSVSEEKGVDERTGKRCSIAEGRMGQVSSVEQVVVSHNTKRGVHLEEDNLGTRFHSSFLLSEIVELSLQTEQSWNEEDAQLHN
jgi:hypothetical protein